MRGITRHFFTACALASLLLAGAVLVGARTAAQPGFLGDDFQRRLVRVGPVFVFIDRYVLGIGVLEPSRPGVSQTYAITDSGGIIAPPRGFQHVRWPTLQHGPDPDAYTFFTNETEFRAITLPAWFVVAFAAVLPTAWAARAVRAYSRRLRGLCAACGYDLRTSPDRCPECGAKPPKKPDPVSAAPAACHIVKQPYNLTP